MESFQVVMQLVLFPMLFLSGAMFPLNNLPTWLTVLTRINPLTYAVQPLRQVVFAAQDMSDGGPASVSHRGHAFRAHPDNRRGTRNRGDLRRRLPRPRGPRLRPARMTPGRATYGWGTNSWGFIDQQPPMLTQARVVAMFA